MTKKFLDLSGLTAYDVRIKSYISGQTSTISDELANEIVRAQQAEELLDERKADVEGSYETMSVGSAKTLEANMLTAVEFTKRTVPSSVGSGLAKLSLLKGNTLVWNQLIEHFGESVSEEVVNGVTWSYDNMTGMFTFQGTCTETSSFETNFTSWTTVDIVPGNKYLVFNANRDEGNTPTLSIRVGDENYNVYVPNRPAEGDLERNTIIEAWHSNSSNYCVYIDFKAGETYDGSCYFNIFDLTKMFGAGNEPSSVEEFEALYPSNNYVPDEGRLLNYKATYFNSTGSDFQQHLYLDVTGLKGKTEGSGSNPEVVMFPDGLKKAGSVYDEIDYKNGVAIKRVGSVDLGTLKYTPVTLTNGKTAFSTGPLITDGYRQLSGRAAGLICTEYTAHDTIINVNIDIGDKLLWQRDSSSALKIFIHDSSYTDRNSFKAAMNGVMLYYELATPIVYHFEPMNNVYRVEQGGTEEVSPFESGGLDGSYPESAPMIADIRYSVDVVGILENLKSDIGDIGTILDQLNGE